MGEWSELKPEKRKDADPPSPPPQEAQHRGLGLSHLMAAQPAVWFR